MHARKNSRAASKLIISFFSRFFSCHACDINAPVHRAANRFYAASYRTIELFNVRQQKKMCASLMGTCAKITRVEGGSASLFASIASS
jgi:hypothetical protein